MQTSILIITSQRDFTSLTTTGGLIVPKLAEDLHGRRGTLIVWMGRKVGDRFYLVKNCAYCNAINSDIYYAPTCSFYGFECEKCGKFSFIKDTLEAIKIEELTEQDVYWAICNASSMLDNATIRKMSKRVFNELKGGNKKDGVKKVDKSSKENSN